MAFHRSRSVPLRSELGPIPNWLYRDKAVWFSSRSRRKPNGSFAQCGRVNGHSGQSQTANKARKMEVDTQ